MGLCCSIGEKDKYKYLREGGNIYIILYRKKGSAFYFSTMDGFTV